MSRRAPASLRIRLTRTLVGLGLISVVLLAGVNLLIVRSLLDSTVQEQLRTLRDLRADSVERGVARLLERTSVLSTDPGMAAALNDLEAGYEAIDAEVDDAQRAELEAAYADVVQRYDDAGAERPLIADLVPESDAGQFVQFQYIAENPNPQGDRGDLLDAGDGSEYSAAHRRQHEYLRAVEQRLGGADLLLVSADSNEVVYSAEKLIDIGTNVVDGPFADTGLGRSLTALSRATAGDAVVVDSEFYLPEQGEPVVHVASAVRADTEVIGAMVLTIPISALTDLVTADERFDEFGLGDSGDVFVVGADERLRTVPRLWFEDQDEYLRRFDDSGGDERTAELMAFTGSPVLLQPVETDAAETALDGGEFIGTQGGYLGNDVIAASTPIGIEGLNWVVVTEQSVAESRQELGRFVLSIGLLLAILLPILALLGALLARALARPVQPLVAAAGRIAEGDFDSEVPDLGRNELGDLGAQLRGVADQLRSQEQHIADEEHRIEVMLASVLPPALIERVRNGDRAVVELLETGTVISLRIEGIPEPSDSETDSVIELAVRVAEDLRRLANEHGVERIRLASEEQLLVAGRTADGAAIEAAVAFADESRAAVRVIADDFGLHLDLHVGLAAGRIATGVLGTNQVAFGVWGDATHTAIVLSDAAGSDEILVDRAVADADLAGWEARPVDGALDIDVDEAFVLDRVAVTTASHDE